MKMRLGGLNPHLPYLLLGSALILVESVTAQTIRCDLTRGPEGGISGQCTGTGESTPIPIELRPSAGRGPKWVGTLEINGSAAKLDVATYEYASGPAEVLRTPFGWYLPVTLDLDQDPPKLAWSMDREAPPSILDREIIARARSLISSESVWDRADNRVCSPADTAYSLYCALADATRTVAGEYQHRQPALQFVRRIVAEQWAERIQGHRLMDFNNDPRTTSADLSRLFDLVQERIGKAIR